LNAEKSKLAILVIYILGISMVYKVYHYLPLTISHHSSAPLDRTNTCQPSAQTPYRYIYKFFPVLERFKNHDFISISRTCSVTYSAE
jgi:hypothetical protein